MKQLYVIILALSFATTGLCTDTDPAPGYIVTKNGKRLTGYIGDIYHSLYGGIVLFINDFGSVYNIEAERIRGFVFSNEKGYTAYESKYFRNQWYFLNILEKGGAVNLYQSPQEEYTISIENGVMTANSRKITEYWLEVKGKKQPMRIGRKNFRRKMRRLFRRTDAPEYREKIGSEGYRFNDLPEIIREFNKERSLKTWQL